jgi:hypothetical protein
MERGGGRGESRPRILATPMTHPPPNIPGYARATYGSTTFYAATTSHNHPHSPPTHPLTPTNYQTAHTETRTQTQADTHRHTQTQKQTDSHTNTGHTHKDTQTTGPLEPTYHSFTSPDPLHPYTHQACGHSPLLHPLPHTDAHQHTDSYPHIHAGAIAPAPARALSLSHAPAALEKTCNFSVQILKSTLSRDLYAVIYRILGH